MPQSLALFLMTPIALGVLNLILKSVFDDADRVIAGWNGYRSGLDISGQCQSWPSGGHEAAHLGLIGMRFIGRQGSIGNACFHVTRQDHRHFLVEVRVGQRQRCSQNKEYQKSQSFHG